MLVDAIGGFGDPNPGEIGAEQIHGFDCHRRSLKPQKPLAEEQARAAISRSNRKRRNARIYKERERNESFSSLGTMQTESHFH